MRAFTSVTGRAAVVLRRDIDTDVLIRIERLIAFPPDELGPWLFEAWRYLPDGTPDPQFPLNDPRCAGARVLVAGENFGCGSSREHAVWALQAYGIDAVIAPSFGDIFTQNCYQNGVLPVPLAVEDVEALSEALAEAGDPVVTVDLHGCTVTGPDGRVFAFTVASDRRAALLEGLDDIGVTLRMVDIIDGFTERDREERPWIHQLERGNR